MSNRNDEIVKRIILNIGFSVVLGVILFGAYFLFAK